ncbi:MAG TPA: nuclear transport factor 2 family protein [Pyrinomonadaceae bacterium]|jgi:ketosteroid isomerase-like protein|nr:nuclear transport factor 2 family protein [Pyrinomonadaceae bacterium]
MNRTLLIVFALLLALALAASAQQQGGYTPALVSLVEAERAFSRTSVERGVRESFLAFFADDGINFQPHPTNTREAFLKRPAPAVRPPVTLYWEPVFADVSRAGDLGYTTGPYRLSDQSAEHRPTQHGYYFSIWKRPPGGEWKVALDVGIKTPAPDDAERRIRFQAAWQTPSAKSAAGNGAPPDLERERESLLKIDRDFINAANTRGTVKAFQTHLAEEARLHRDGIFPLTSREAIRAYLSRKHSTLSGEPLKADVAQSNDLGYTYGRYELREDGAPQDATAGAEKGYYVRVWKRDAARGAGGRWRIVLDTTHPLPPAEK